MRSRNVRRPRSSEQKLKNRHSRTIGGATVIAVGAAALLFASSQSANAIGTTIGLGAADSYAVLGGQSVTNDHGTILGGNTVLWGDLGVSPGTAISGFPPGIRLGTTHVNDTEAQNAQIALVTAYNAAAAQAPDATIVGDLGGQTLDPGVYVADSSIGLTGPVTLDAHGDPDAVFIFQIGSTLTTATASSVVPVNGATSCNIFWQIGSSATLGERTSFVGTIMALTSITLNSGATVDGRALARNGSVTLLDNVFTGAPCATTPTSPPPTDTPNSPSPSDTSTTPPTTPGDTGTGGNGGTGGTPGGGNGTTGGGSGTTGSGASRGGGSGGSLANTGFELTPLIAGAGATVLLGLGLMASTIRRTSRTSNRTSAN